jgi:hypothetical protein
MTMYDASDAEVTVMADAVKVVYEVSARKLINGPSTSMILVAKTSTNASISVETPSQVQLSSPPLSGSFKIKCVDKNGIESFSQEIPFHQWSNWVNQKTMEGCDGLYDKIEILESYENAYKENGLGFFIRF